MLSTMLRSTLPEIMAKDKGASVSGEFVKGLLNLMPFLMICTALGLWVVFRTRRGVRYLITSTSQLNELVSSSTSEDVEPEKPEKPENLV